MNGPLRNNGADKLPSLDWKIAFSGLATKFTSRIVSTGDNFFINLGGQDFEAGQQAVQQLTDQAQESKQKGLAQVGLNPLAAVRNVKAAGDRTFDGETLKVYKGAIDVDAVLDQIERLSQGLPNAGAAQTIPRRQAHGRAARAGQAHVRQPRFEVGRRRRRHHPPAPGHLHLHDPRREPRGRGRHHRRPHRVPRRLHRGRRGRPRSRRRRTRSRSPTSRSRSSRSSRSAASSSLGPGTARAAGPCAPPRRAAGPRAAARTTPGCGAPPPPRASSPRGCGSCGA